MRGLADRATGAPREHPAVFVATVTNHFARAGAAVLRLRQSPAKWSRAGTRTN